MENEKSLNDMTIDELALLLMRYPERVREFGACQVNCVNLSNFFILDGNIFPYITIWIYLYSNVL